MFRDIRSLEYNALAEALCTAAIDAKACGGDHGTYKKLADADAALTKYINEWANGPEKSQNKILGLSVKIDESLPPGEVLMDGVSMVRAEAPELNPQDLQIDTYRHSGVGGWANMPDICVRITHLPTGLKVEESTNRSQHRNRAEAMKKLRVLVADRGSAPARRRSDESLVALATAQNLATAIWAAHYKDSAPNFEVLTDIMGVLSQIDNMVAGLTRKD